MISILLGTFLAVVVGLLWRRVYVVNIGKMLTLAKLNEEDSVFLEERKCFYLTIVGYVATLCLLGEFTYRISYFSELPYFSATLWSQAVWFFFLIVPWMLSNRLRRSIALLAVWDLVPVINLLGAAVTALVFIKWGDVWAGLY